MSYKSYRTFTERILAFLGLVNVMIPMSLFCLYKVFAINVENNDLWIISLDLQIDCERRKDYFKSF